MVLSSVALHCLFGNSFFIQELFGASDEIQKIQNERRKLYNEYLGDANKFYEYTRLSLDTFDYILARIQDYVPYKITSKRALNVQEKLLITLRYLSHGTPFSSLAKLFNISRSTASNVIYQTMKALWRVFRRRYLPRPTRDHFKEIAEGFYSRHQFPNCIGAIGAKQFRKRLDQRVSGSKAKHLTLQAISDSNYRFIDVDVLGTGESFQSSTLGDLMERNQFNVPPAAKLPGSSVAATHVLVGNEGFPLKTYLMRPYPAKKLDRSSRVFNERLSRARASVDKAFAVLLNKWRVLGKVIETTDEHAKLTIRVACVLHNVVRQRDGDSDPDFREFLDDVPTESTTVLKWKGNNRSTGAAVALRDRFRHHFVSNPMEKAPLLQQ